MDYCGIYSGWKKDKGGIFGVFGGVLGRAPMVEECPLNLECRLTETLELGSHILVVGEIVETYINRDCLTEDKADSVKIDPLIFDPGTVQYHRLGERITSVFQAGK